ncbi:MAG: hypothetical protein ACRD1T_11920 [Acidimicrobiia bacterium]
MLRVSDAAEVTEVALYPSRVNRGTPTPNATEHLCGHILMASEPELRHGVTLLLNAVGAHVEIIEPLLLAMVRMTASASEY